MKNSYQIRGLVIAAIATFFAAEASGQEGLPSDPQSGFEFLSMPSDTAINGKGQTYIVDSGNHQVAIYDATGLKTLTLGTMGEEEGQLMNPLGIGVSAKGEVYVADRGNERIVMFDAKGRARKHFEIEADGKGVVPVDIAVDAKGRELYITDNANHRVVVTNAKGEFQRAWGGEGEDDGQFLYPATIDIDANGNVWVVDVINARVQKFDSAGTHLQTIGKRGGKEGTFYRPKGVVVDEAGNIYVSDSFLGIIQVFTPDGEFNYVIGEAGEPTIFETPVGLAAAAGKLYVTEMLPGKVSVVTPTPPPPPAEEEAAE